MDEEDDDNPKTTSDQPAFKLARITLGNGERIACVMREASASGAKISVSQRHALPEFFHVSVDGRPEICRVRQVWRRGDEVGVTIQDVDPGQPPVRPEFLKL